LIDNQKGSNALKKNSCDRENGLFFYYQIGKNKNLQYNFNFLALPHWRDKLCHHPAGIIKGI